MTQASPRRAALCQGVSASAGFLGNLGRDGSAVHAGDGATGGHEEVCARHVIDAQVTNVAKLGIDAPVGESPEEVLDLVRRRALGVVDNAQRRMVNAAAKAVGVCPTHICVSNGIDSLAHHVVRRDVGVLLGELAVGLGGLDGTGDLDGRGHARRAVCVELTELIVARLLVEEDVHARDGDRCS